MNRTVALLITTACATPLGAACASDPDVSQVQRTVDQRLGQRVEWRRDTPQDEQVDASIEALLQQPLTADAAVQVALLRNRSLHARYESIGVAQADLVEAGLLSNPVFDGDVRYELDPTPIANLNDVSNRVVFEVGIHQDFVDLLILPFRRNAASAALDVAHLAVSLAVFDLAYTTRSTYLGLVAAQRRVSLARDDVELAEAGLLFARALSEAKNLADVDLLHVEIAYAQARLRLQSAELEAASRAERLTGLLGLYGDDRRPLVPDDLPSPPSFASEGFEQTVIAKSLDLELHRRQIRSASKHLGYVNVEGLIPELDVGLEVERDETFQVGPAFDLELPLFDRGQGRTASAEAQLRRRRQLYLADAVTLRAQARAAQVRLVAAAERDRYAHEVVVPLHHRLVEETARQVNGMFLSTLDLVEARRDLVDAEVDALRARHDHWQARAAVDQLLAGRRLRDGDTDLEAPEDDEMSLSMQRRGGH